jgi:hypothetical protein
MSVAFRNMENRLRVKRELAAKYFSLAKHTKAQPKREAYLYKAERYTNQAEVLSRKLKLLA